MVCKASPGNQSTKLSLATHIAFTIHMQVELCMEVPGTVQHGMASGSNHIMVNISTTRQDRNKERDEDHNVDYPAATLYHIMADGQF
ncbi:hypothetical protein BaRGS_00033561 [Batillaria attramentaria]|uniref:Uncharacterized protein n=1 Tax=Batillaria attramentaria TaxID=370345 RepID=A0ABD0JJN9_9CAEN